ncbi:MAG TPA: hypothetical protein VE975_01720 [Actinomycetota bacterium]|nr:hypothetical protein [Actinomycetota bacterium]
MTDVLVERRAESHDLCWHQPRSGPLFTDELIMLVRRLIPEERQGHVGDSIVVRARLPE